MNLPCCENIQADPGLYYCFQHTGVVNDSVECAVVGWMTFFTEECEYIFNKNYNTIHGYFKLKKAEPMEELNKRFFTTTGGKIVGEYFNTFKWTANVGASIKKVY